MTNTIKPTVKAVRKSIKHLTSYKVKRDGKYVVVEFSSKAYTQSYSSALFSRLLRHGYRFSVSMALKQLMIFAQYTETGDEE